MNIKELKKLIEDLSDEMEVVVYNHRTKKSDSVLNAFETYQEKELYKTAELIFSIFPESTDFNDGFDIEVKDKNT